MANGEAQLGLDRPATIRAQPDPLTAAQVRDTPVLSREGLENMRRAVGAIRDHFMPLSANVGADASTVPLPGSQRSLNLPAFAELAPDVVTPGVAPAAKAGVTSLLALLMRAELRNELKEQAAKGGLGLKQAVAEVAERTAAPNNVTMYPFKTARAAKDLDKQLAKLTTPEKTARFVAENYQVAARHVPKGLLDKRQMEDIGYPLRRLEDAMRIPAESRLAKFKLRRMEQWLSGAEFNANLRKIHDKIDWTPFRRAIIREKTRVLNLGAK